MKRTTIQTKMVLPIKFDCSQPPSRLPSTQGMRPNIHRDRMAENSAMVTCEIKLFQNIISASSRPTEINFISARGNLLKIILKLFQKLIAAHEYFPTCS